MDLSYYYTPAISASNFVPTQLYLKDNSDIDERLDLLESTDVGTASQIAAINTKLAGWSNIIFNVSGLSKEDSDKWHDFIGPIITGGADILGDVFGHFLNSYKDQFKDALKDALKDLLGSQDINIGVGEDDDILTPPDNMVSFKTLSSNLFAFDRTVGQIQKNFGCTLDRDLNLLSTSKLNIVDPGTITANTPYGTGFSTIMSSNALYPIMDFTDMSFRMKSGQITSNLALSNAACSNFFSSNVSSKYIKVSSGETDLLGASLPAEIQSDGSGKFYSLNVNNNLIIRPDGSVIVNGVTVIAPSGRPVVYDDQVLPSAAGYNLDDVLSGNIGSDDILDFCNFAPSYGDEEIRSPLSFAYMLNQEDATRIALPEHAASDASSVSFAISRAQSEASSVQAALPSYNSLPSQPSVASVFSLDLNQLADLEDTVNDLDEDDAWEIDLVTGKVINPSTPVTTAVAPPPVVVQPASLAERMGSFDRFVGDTAVNAPLHWVGGNTAFQSTLGFNDSPAFPIAYQFNDEDNAWPATVHATLEDEAWKNVLNIAEQHLNMANHVGLTKSDELVVVAAQGDPPPLLSFGSDAFAQTPLYSFPSNAF